MVIFGFSLHLFMDQKQPKNMSINQIFWPQQTVKHWQEAPSCVRKIEIINLIFSKAFENLVWKTKYVLTKKDFQTMSNWTLKLVVQTKKFGGLPAQITKFPTLTQPYWILTLQCISFRVPLFELYKLSCKCLSIFCIHSYAAIKHQNLILPNVLKFFLKINIKLTINA